MKNRPYTCGVDIAITALGGRWRTIVLARIKQGATGFAQLRRQIPGISEKMLSAALRDLVDAGFVCRSEVKRRPLGVCYTLTEEGCRIAPALAALNAWGEAFARGHGLTIVKPRRVEAQSTEHRRRTAV